MDYLRERSDCRVTYSMMARTIAKAPATTKIKTKSKNAVVWVMRREIAPLSAASADDAGALLAIGRARLREAGSSRPRHPRYAVNSCGSAFASFRSRVSNPSVNHPVYRS